MSMKFQDLITLMMMVGFLGVISTVILADVLIFEEEPGHSDMALMLIGALIGAVSTYINFIYKK